MLKLPAQIFHFAAVVFHFSSVIFHNAAVILVQAFYAVALFGKKALCFCRLMGPVVFHHFAEDGDVAEIQKGQHADC